MYETQGLPSRHRESGVPAPHEADPFHVARVEEYKRHIEDIYSVSGDEETAVRLIEKIGRKLEADGPYKGAITYKVIHNAAENAFAAGTTVYIYSGLLAKLKSESQIAGVIAHEISHIEHGDTMQENNAKRTMGEELSRGRIEEYMADSIAHKLNDARYNPASYEAVLAHFAKNEWSTDFTHGSSGDRQSAYRAQLHVFDFETSAQVDVSEKPHEFSEEYLKPMQRLSKFEVLRESLEKTGKVAPESVELLATMRASSLMILWSEELSEVKDLKSTMTWEDYKRSYNGRQRGEKLNELKAHTRLTAAAARALSERIEARCPGLSSEEKTWLATLIYTQMGGEGLKELQEVAEFLAKKVPREFPLFEKDLLASVVGSAEDFIRFARFSTEYSSHAAEVGLVSKDEKYAGRIFDEGNPYDTSQKESFFFKVLRSIRAKDASLDIPAFLAQLEEAVKISDSTNTSGRAWFKDVTSKLFKMRVPALFAEFGRKLRSIKRIEKNALPDTLRLFVDRIAGEIARYAPLLRAAGAPHAEQELINDFDAVLRDTSHKLKLNWQVELMLRKGITASVIEKQQEQSDLFRSFSGIGTLTAEEQREFFSGLTVEMLGRIRSFAPLEEIFPDPNVRKAVFENLMSYMLEDYTPNEAELLSLRRLAETRAVTPALKEWKDGGKVGMTPQEHLEAGGFSLPIIRLLLALEVQSALAGGEVSEAILKRINVIWPKE